MENKNLSLRDFRETTIISNLYSKPDLFKSEHKKHKYLRKENGKYIYHESYQSTKGGRAFHHTMMEKYHEAKKNKASGDWFGLVNNHAEGYYTKDKVADLSSKAEYHAKQQAHHKSERIKHINSFNSTINNDEHVRDYNQRVVEHNNEGIDAKKYGEAHEEYEKNKDAVKGHTKISIGDVKVGDTISWFGGAQDKTFKVKSKKDTADKEYTVLMGEVGDDSQILKVKKEGSGQQLWLKGGKSGFHGQKLKDGTAEEAKAMTKDIKSGDKHWGN